MEGTPLDPKLALEVGSHKLGFPRGLWRIERAQLVRGGATGQLSDRGIRGGAMRPPVKVRHVPRPEFVVVRNNPDLTVR